MVYKTKNEYDFSKNHTQCIKTLFFFIQIEPRNYLPILDKCAARASP